MRSFGIWSPSTAVCHSWKCSVYLLKLYRSCILGKFLHFPFWDRNLVFSFSLTIAEDAPWSIRKNASL